MALAQVLHRTVEIDGHKIAYHEAGTRGAPAVVLLHGYPGSSLQYERLLPALADHWHVVAPDFPGFGESVTAKKFNYSFDAYADLLNSFVKALDLQRFSLYLHSLSLHVGFRLAMKDPNRIIGLIMQNGDVYSTQPGALPASKSTPNQSPAPDQPKAMEGLAKNLAKSEAWLEDYQAYLRDNQPPVLLVWGAQNGALPQENRDAYSRDLPHAEVNMLPGGQQLLETDFAEVVSLVRSFLDRVA